MTQMLEATIADEARFVGIYKGRDLTVLGAFEGGLELTGRLHLGPAARVKGQVRAASVEIEGDFEGEVRAEALAFGPGARARGVFLAPRLSIRDGARVEGALNVEPAPAQPATTARGAAKGKPSADVPRVNGVPPEVSAVVALPETALSLAETAAALPA